MNKYVLFFIRPVSIQTLEIAIHPPAIMGSRYVYVQAVGLVALDPVIHGIPVRHEARVAAVDGCPRDGEREHPAPVRQGDAPDLLELFKDLLCGNGVCYVTVCIYKQNLSVSTLVPILVECQGSMDA